MEFEWDEDKRGANIAAHGVDFDLAKDIFRSPIFSWVDDRFAYDELRENAVGMLVYEVQDETVVVLACRFHYSR